MEVKNFTHYKSFSVLDTISRNRVPSRVTSELEKQCHSLPWLPPQSLPLSDPLWAELDSLPLSPNPERPLEDLPDVTPEFTSVLSPPFKVIIIAVINMVGIFL